MEKISLPECWQDKFDRIWDSIPESDGPDMDAMDTALTKLMELMVVMAGEIVSQENTIKRLEKIVVSLDIAKDLISEGKENSEVNKDENLLYL
jgi:hypothetical protein